MKSIKTALTALTALVMTTGGVAAQEHLKSLNPAYFDNNVPASQDFYKHVNAGWQKAHPLTPEYSRYGQFNIMNDSSEMRVKNIVLGLKGSNPAPGTVAYKVSTIYEQAMDSTRRNREGANPIKPLLKKIEETPSNGMDDLFIWMHTNYSSPFLSACPM